MPPIDLNLLLAAVTPVQPVGAAPWLPSATAGAAVLVGLAMIGWQVWQRRSNRTSLPRTPSQARHGGREFEEFGREATEVVDRLASLLDAKADRIERLIAEADRKILALERAAGSQARRDEFSDGPRRAIRPQSGTRLSEESMAGDPVLHDRIAELAERGLRPVEIAKQLHQPIGQVELVIALRRGALKL